MEWLEKAAEKYATTKETQMKQKKVSEVIQESFPKKVDELWNSFHKIYQVIGIKFGSTEGYHADSMNMQLVVGDVMITGIAERADIAGGYYGIANIKIEYLNSTRAGKLHFDRLLLGEIKGEPTWVYRDVVNNVMTDVVFDENEVEKVFKSALSIYL